MLEFNERATPSLAFCFSPYRQPLKSLNEAREDLHHDAFAFYDDELLDDI